MATQKRSLRMKMLKSQNETVSKCNETTEVASENEPPNSNGDDKSLHEEKKVNEKANSLKKKVNDEAEKCVIKDEPLDDEFNIKDDNKIPDNPFNGFNKTPIKRVNDKAAEQELQILIKDEPLDDWHQNAESLGKGKRSRIPNKRYSDILSPPTYSRKSSFGFPLGNGSFGKIESGIDTDNSATNEPRLKKQRMSVDLSDKKYKKPFKYGWKRELVWRAVYDESKGRVGDIYYFTPDGKKVRSRNEVLQHLYNRDLTIDNFTFFKAEIGLNDPTKEIVRNAKPITNKSFTNTSLSSPRSPKTSTPKLAIQKIDTPNLAVQKSGSPRITPKLTGSKVSSSRVRNPVVAIAKLTNSTVDTPKSWIPIIMPNKRDLNESKDSPHKNKTPKMKTPVRKDVKKANEKAAEKMEVDPPSTKSSLTGRTRRSRQSTVQNTREPSPVVAKIIAKVSAANNNTTTKKRTIKLSSITNTEEKERDVKFMDNYVQNLSFGYKTLLHIFQYLKVQDLLRAGCVCTMWRDLTSHPLLWKTIRMKNSQVHSFEGLANSLKKHGTVHLDLRKMLLPNGGDEIWTEFSKAIAKVDTLRRIELCRCPSFVVENLGVSNPLLEVINAVTIKCESMSLEPLKHLTHIHEFRLKSTGGLNLTSNLDAFTEMKSLKYLSLTSIRELDRMNLNVIATLTNLESLDLGECTDFPKGFGEEVLLKLTKLERLRLEKGQGSCHTFEILGAVKQMDHLEQLELVNFDIKAGFDKALGTCLNVKKLLIIPTYISQSATTNHMLLGAVLRLQKTLSHFVWGVTLELLRVTELFIDQCEEPKERRDKKQNANGDCIPVLKPVPLLPDNDTEIAPALEPPQVEILALPSLQKLLMQNLPTTRVKILKIPFHATWRQSITDSSN